MNNHAIIQALMTNKLLHEGYQKKVLHVALIRTSFGEMIAVADEVMLYLLEFVTRNTLEKELTRIKHQGFDMVAGETAPIVSIKQEISAYFAGKLVHFNTPYRISGTLFQQSVWQSLCDIPYGETTSYLQQAISLGKPTGYRAVANANGANQLAIIIPCHRVIASDGSLGGYGGGLTIKRKLLAHEVNHASTLKRGGIVHV